MTATTTKQVGRWGRILLALDTSPWDTCYRAIIGYMMMPTYFRVAGARGEFWRLVFFVILVLAALRMVPGLARRIASFPHEVAAAWAERRALAKLYDSYQWRKLLGVGVGWLVYLVATDEPWFATKIAAAAFIFAGVLGQVTWNTTSRQLAVRGNAPTAATQRPS